MTSSNPRSPLRDVSNDSDLPLRNLNIPNGSKTHNTESDAPALPATTSTGTAKALEATFQSLPPIFVVERPLRISPQLIQGPTYGIPVESMHCPTWCLAGETRMKLQLYVGISDPRVPERVVQRMNRLMTGQDELPTTKRSTTSGGMDTMEYPM
jgi:hypothetical protein